MKLSIVIPIFNEARTIEQIVAKVDELPLDLDKELVLVDDGSTDGTAEIVKRLLDSHPDWKSVSHDKNRGKGAALRSGFKIATGDIIVIQDADLEYAPTDYHAMLEPVLSGHADVVYGSRFLGGGPHRVCFFWHYLGNKLITGLSNMMTNINLTDVEVCYKMFKKEVLEAIELKEDRFGFEIEITAKVARAKWRIYEVPVAYYGRSYKEGKKITWRDGMWALWCILKYC